MNLNKYLIKTTIFSPLKPEKLSNNKGKQSEIKTKTFVSMELKIKLTKIRTITYQITFTKAVV